MECLNCFTQKTPMWRNSYCNACSIYYKRHKVHKDIVKECAKNLMFFKYT